MPGIRFPHKTGNVFFRLDLERLGRHLDSWRQLIGLFLHLLRCATGNGRRSAADHFTADIGGLCVIQLLQLKDLSMLYPVDALVNDRIVDRTEVS